MILPPPDPSASPMEEALPLIDELGLPVAVSAAFRATLAGEGAIPSQGATRVLAPGWWLSGLPAGGMVLVEEAGGKTPLRRAEADCGGGLTVLLRWREGPALEEAALRLPEGDWLTIRPRATHHALWGCSDELIVRRDGQPRRIACCEAVDYAAISHIPPLDRPGSIPPGGGEALLNLLAALLADQGKPTVRYRGPYPTAQLFHSLRRSFRCMGRPEEQLAVFTQRELELALSPACEEAPVDWLPHPHSVRLGQDAVRVHLRPLGGPHARDAAGAPKLSPCAPETVWVGSTSFRTGEPEPEAEPEDKPGDKPGEPPAIGTANLAAGPRIWREGSGAAPRYHAGLVLLGAPFRRVLVLDGEGRILERFSPPKEQAGAVRRGGSQRVVSNPWREALAAWAALNSTPLLAAEILPLARSLDMRWAPLAYGMAEVQGEILLLQEEVFPQLARLRGKRRAPEQVLMLISDVLGGALPHLRRLAQLRLEQSPQKELHRLLEEGRGAQAAARETLTGCMPLLVRELLEGPSFEGSLPET